MTSSPATDALAPPLHNNQQSGHRDESDEALRRYGLINLHVAFHGHHVHRPQMPLPGSASAGRDSVGGRRARLAGLGDHQHPLVAALISGGIGAGVRGVRSGCAGHGRPTRALTPGLPFLAAVARVRALREAEFMVMPRSRTIPQADLPLSGWSGFAWTSPSSSRCGRTCGK
jgi:hypothetical protein